MEPKEICVILNINFMIIYLIDVVSSFEVDRSFFGRFVSTIIVVDLAADVRIGSSLTRAVTSLG